MSFHHSFCIEQFDSHQNDLVKIDVWNFCCYFLISNTVDEIQQSFTEKKKKNLLTFRPALFASVNMVILATNISISCLVTVRYLGHEGCQNTRATSGYLYYHLYLVYLGYPCL
jgi:hypothetical protein